MSVSTFLFVALAGGVGACTRFWLDRGTQRALSSWDDPVGAKLGILVVNVVGCFLAGVATQLVPAHLMPIVSTGFLGGFTTFLDRGCGRGHPVGGWFSGAFAGSRAGHVVGVLGCGGRGHRRRVSLVGAFRSLLVIWLCLLSAIVCYLSAGLACAIVTQKCRT